MGVSPRRQLGMRKGVSECVVSCNSVDGGNRLEIQWRGIGGWIYVVVCREE